MFGIMLDAGFFAKVVIQGLLLMKELLIRAEKRVEGVHLNTWLK
jgi:hypothetical protein